MARDLQRGNGGGQPMARPPMQPRGMQQQGPPPMQQQQPQGGGIAPVGIRPVGGGGY